MQVSLFASAVRPKLWPALFKSLEGTSVKYEVIFAGNNRKLIVLKGLSFTIHLKVWNLILKILQPCQATSNILKLEI